MSYMVEPTERTARASVQDASVSTKHAIMLCKFLRGKQLETAIELCERIQKKTEAVPFTRFTDGVGHRKGDMAAGRYPVKTAKAVQELLESVKSNALNQGLGGDLRITHLAANRASRPLRNRLKYRGEFKRTHLEVQVTGVEAKKEPEKKPEKAASKKESKPEETKEEKDRPEKKEEKETEEDTPAKPKGQDPGKKETPEEKEKPAAKEEKAVKEAEKKEAVLKEETPVEKKGEAAVAKSEPKLRDPNVHALQGLIEGLKAGKEPEDIREYYADELDEQVRSLFEIIEKDEPTRLVKKAEKLIAEYEGKNGN